MKAVDRLLAHEDFRAAITAIEAKEAQRRFCRHGLAHALDVARILWILVLENQHPFDKETVYLTALLHDLGRSITDADHDLAGAQLADRLLADCGLDASRRQEICAAIGAHRSKSDRLDPSTADLATLLVLADKKSRPCFRCPAASDCYWPETLKNHTITY